MTAAETDGDPAQTFGSVSRLRGLAFEYLTLGASLVGIVSLAILLGYVAIDAFGLDAAGPAWYATYAVVLGLPTVAFLGYAFRSQVVWAVLTGTLVRLFGGSLLAVSITVLFIIADIQLWFLLYSIGVLPAIVLYSGGVIRDRPGLTFPGAPLVLLGGSALGIVLKGPLSVFPTDWVIYLWTFAIPAVVAFGGWANRRTSRRHATALSVAALLGCAAVSRVVATLTAIDAGIGLVLAVTPGLLVVAYAGDVVVKRPAGRLGLLFPIVVLLGLLAGSQVVATGSFARPEPWLTTGFLTRAPSRFPGEAGLYPAIIGSVFIISLVAVISFVFGVGSAIYLEEYAPQRGPGGALTRTIQVNISNLAGVPSVVYGLLGLGIFVNLVGLGFGVVLVAALTLSLLILPIVIIAAQEAIRSVPDSMRQASYGMGATRWQTVRNVVLPEALPGILTGTILALGRAIGETAPLIIIGLATTKFTPPSGLLSRTTAMPTQIYAWAFLPDEAFRYGVVAAGVWTLVSVLLAMNSVAIYLRNKYQTDR